MTDEQLNTCFAGECLVEMADGQLKNVYNIEKGDKVQTEFGMAEVLSVLKKFCKNGEADLINVRTNSSTLIMTPSHSIKWEGKWSHASGLFSNSLRGVRPCTALYSFLLDGDNTMIIGGNIVLSHVVD